MWAVPSKSGRGHLEVYGRENGLVAGESGCRLNISMSMREGKRGLFVEEDASIVKARGAALALSRAIEPTIPQRNRLSSLHPSVINLLRAVDCSRAARSAGSSRVGRMKLNRSSIHQVPLFMMVSSSASASVSRRQPLKIDERFRDGG